MPSDKVSELTIAVEITLVHELRKLGGYLRKYWLDEMSPGETTVDVAIRLMEQLRLVRPGR